MSNETPTPEGPETPDQKFAADPTGGLEVPAPDAEPESPEVSQEQKLFAAIDSKLKEARSSRALALGQAGAASLAVANYETFAQANEWPGWMKVATLAVAGISAGVAAIKGISARMDRREAEALAAQGAAGNFDLPSDEDEKETPMPEQETQQ